jgi:hypothetical protein
MAHSKNETITVAWCDGGYTDGLFTEGLIRTFFTTRAPLRGIFRIPGSQISRQRQGILDLWYDDEKSTDWLLWIDSDIELTSEALDKVWDAADKFTHPIVTGIYFVSLDKEGDMQNPQACIFYQNKESEYQMNPIWPIPENQLLQIDYSGMGFVLMHRSVVTKLREIFPNGFMFEEEQNPGEKFVGEDINFFKKIKNAQIPVYAHTGAMVRHIKRFALSFDYTKKFMEEKNGI